jgi:hypothetical protein
MKRARPIPKDAEKLLRAQGLHAPELRLMVANFYQAQEMRKTLDMQIRHLGDRLDVLPDDHPMKVLALHVSKTFGAAEEDMAWAFGKLLNSPVATWILAQRGFGNVIAAGLLAHIDIEKAPTAGHIWRFAGLDPTMKWEKGEKRPYNAKLKQVCWHAGQCLMKQSKDPDCYYGRLYRERKEYEIKRNEAGGNAERAKTFKVLPGATKVVKDKLKAGKLPDFNIDARARRYAVKIFLSHLHTIMFWDRFKTLPPKPFAISILGHAHEISIPHVQLFPDLAAALHSSQGRRKSAA